MRRVTLLIFNKKKTSIFHHLSKRPVSLQKMMSVDVPLDQLFLKFIIAVFLLSLPYTGVLMFIYFVK